MTEDRLWAPKHWPVWALVGLMQAVAALPFGTVLAIGRRLGRAAYRAGGRRRIVADYNLRACFPDWSPAERDALCRRHHEALAIGFFESFLCWGGSFDRLRRLARVEGIEHLDAGLAGGRGVLMLSGHFTTLEVGGKLLTMQRRVAHMFNPPDHPVVRAVMTRGRARYSDTSIPRDDVRGLLRALRGNQAIWYASDQGFEGKGSRPVPFFGVPAPTNVALSRIARMSGAAVVPFFCERLPGSAGYLLRVLPPLENFPTDDEVEDARTYHRLLEDQIRRAPEQYLWSHDRFQARPHKR